MPLTPPLWLPWRTADHRPSLWAAPVGPSLAVGGAGGVRVVLAGAQAWVELASAGAWLVVRALPPVTLWSAGGRVVVEDAAGPLLSWDGVALSQPAGDAPRALEAAARGGRPRAWEVRGGERFSLPEGARRARALDARGACAAWCDGGFLYRRGHDGRCLAVGPGRDADALWVGPEGAVLAGPSPWRRVGARQVHARGLPESDALDGALAALPTAPLRAWEGDALTWLHGDARARLDLGTGQASVVAVLDLARPWALAATARTGGDGPELVGPADAAWDLGAPRPTPRPLALGTAATVASRNRWWAVDTDGRVARLRADGSRKAVPAPGAADDPVVGAWWDESLVRVRASGRAERLDDEGDAVPWRRPRPPEALTPARAGLPWRALGLRHQLDAAGTRWVWSDRGALVRLGRSEA
jgi:hypothetical protein